LLSSALAIALTSMTDRLLPGAHLLAQATTTQPATAPAAGGGKPAWFEFFNSPMAPLFIVIIVIYVLMFTSRRKQDRQKKDLLGNIKRGDRVQTVGGVLGKVVEADADKVLLKVDESSNTKIWFSRNAIHRVLGEEKNEKSETKS
jgi:preprotein translocase subunit YajC